MWGPDIPPNSISPYTALWHFVIAASGIIGAGFLIKAIGPDPPAVRRQYPYDGLVKELGGLQENKVYISEIYFVCMT
jgi:NADH dehydrogenase (ubiquinone) 1 beta subcomplex subunit 8